MFSLTFGRDFGAAVINTTTFPCFDRPWHGYIDMKLLKTEAGAVKMGDTVEFLIENIYRNGRALVMWGSAFAIRKKVKFSVCYCMSSDPVANP